MTGGYLSVQPRRVNQAVLFPADTALTVARRADACVSSVPSVGWQGPVVLSGGVGTVPHHKIN